MRCNHCDAAPCIEICPTSALFRRDDGIVDFDNTRCIGCKSCMQACPYDALYIDPDTHTAAKCNFCAHRIELQLEPACVVVCPTQAIIPGDLDNPGSRIAQMVATQNVVSRKPHKGTQPKLFYSGIDSDFMRPAMMEGQVSHVFAGHNPAANPYSLEHSQDSAAAPSSSRVVYDVAHPQPWGVIPAFYLWTKSIAAGLLIVAALLIFTNRLAGADAIISNILNPVMALVFLGVTVILLIADLDRPDRFYYILTKSNSHSWLVWGTWILIAYGLLALGWLGLRHTDAKRSAHPDGAGGDHGCRGCCLFGIFVRSRERARPLAKSSFSLALDHSGSSSRLGIDDSCHGDGHDLRSGIGRGRPPDSPHHRSVTCCIDPGERNHDTGGNVYVAAHSRR